jgi:hypothetical protein
MFDNPYVLDIQILCEVEIFINHKFKLEQYVVFFYHGSLYKNAYYNINPLRSLPLGTIYNTRHCCQVLQGML